MEKYMELEIFLQARKTLGKTQKEIAELLGVSLKTIHSYEQGWRTIPPHVERQMLFLLSQRRENTTKPKPCWVVKNCPPVRKKSCPAHEFNAGKLCWMVTGTICENKVQKSWQEKMKICRKCEVVQEFS